MENMVTDDRLLFFGSLFISLSATQFLEFMISTPDKCSFVLAPRRWRAHEMN